MKIKVNEASGLVLNWLVAEAEGWFEPLSTLLPGSVAMLDRGRILFRYGPEDDNEFDPVNDWSQGGLIIERKRISVIHSAGTGIWRASIFTPDRDNLDVVVFGATALEAAMRCYVISELGDEVEVGWLHKE